MVFSIASLVVLPNSVANMTSVTAIPVPKSDKELKVFYHKRWKDSMGIIETKIARIEQLVTQKADDLKAIKYLL